MRRLLSSASIVVLVVGLGLSGVATAQEPESTTTTTTTEDTAATTAPANASAGESAPYDPPVDPQVVGGVTVSTTQFPWIAALLVDQSIQPDPFEAQYCGGSLIHPEWVLTAAHCVSGPDPIPDLPAEIEVVLEETDLRQVVPDDRRNISAIHVHPSYNASTRENDFALLKLSAPALGIPTVEYAINTSSEGLNTPAVIAGWGANNTVGTTFPFLLQAGGILVLQGPGGTSCNGYTAGSTFFTASQICAGISQSGGTPDNCIFDDGGPLVARQLGGWKLIGVTTDVGPCGTTRPSLYARVSSATAFIETHVIFPSGANGTFHPVDPFRLVDTRFNVGKLGSGIVGPLSVITPQIIGMGTGPNQVPLTDVNAVVVNVAVTSPNAAGFLTLFPTGTAQPNAANLNYVAGQTVGNLATVRLGQGKFSLANSGGVSAHVIIDVVGYYQDTSTGAWFHEMVPKRIVDTRFGTPDNVAGQILQNPARTVTVCGGATGVDEEASAVVANISVLAGGTYGWITAWPTGAAPTVSNLNFSAGQATASLATIRVGPLCTIQVGNTPGAGDFHAGVHVIIDVVGYYGVLGVQAGGAEFHAMVPNRIVDTRNNQPQPLTNPAMVGMVGPELSIEPFACGGASTVPGTAVAVIVNTVATQPTAFGWLTVYPGDAVLPEASNLLFPPGGTVPNAVFVKVDPVDCKIFVTNSKSPSGPNTGAGSTHVVVDHMGWFEP